MVAAICSFLLVSSPWVEPSQVDGVVGLATYMSEGRMQGVLDYRDSHLPVYDVVAANRAGDRGRWVYLQWPGGEIDGPLLVVDCAQRGEHFEKRERQGRVVEVSAALAKRRGFYGVGPLPVVLWFKKPPAYRWN